LLAFLLSSLGVLSSPGVPFVLVLALGLIMEAGGAGNKAKERRREEEVSCRVSTVRLRWCWIGESTTNSS
jgi:hypothetical protein